MTITQLFKQRFTLYDTAHQSHLTYAINVPNDIEALEIDFQYGPIYEANRASIERSLLKEGLPVDTLTPDTRIRNLLTLSVDDPQGFRGAHHLFDPHQTIRLRPDEASLGFIAGDISAGTWEITISCHGVFSDEVTGQLTLSAHSQRAPKTQRDSPLSQTNPEPTGKIRPLAAHALGLNYQKIELHSHTTHSDASQTTREIVQEASSIGLDWLAITDHNTVTAHFDILEEKVAIPQGLKLVAGIEYTTFYGHFLVHGALDHLLLNWTKVNLGNVSDYLAQLKQDPLNITIAHPFDEGNPYCTGCRWDFNLPTLRHVDSLEVWNGTNPHRSLANQEAFEKWTHLLADGYEINASYGRDWHRPTDEQFAFTYVLLPEGASEADLLAALNLGRTYVSLRPVIKELIVNEQYYLGDRLVDDQLATWQIRFRLADLNSGDSLKIYSEAGLVREISLEDTQALDRPLLVEVEDQGYRLLRFEILNATKERLAFTNPIYRQL